MSQLNLTNQLYANQSYFINNSQNAHSLNVDEAS